MNKNNEIIPGLYYCEVGGHYWYYGDDGDVPKYYCWYDELDIPEEINIPKKYCGCND